MRLITNLNGCPVYCANFKDIYDPMVGLPPSENTTYTQDRSQSMCEVPAPMKSIIHGHANGNPAQQYTS